MYQASIPKNVVSVRPPLAKLSGSAHVIVFGRVAYAQPVQPRSLATIFALQTENMEVNEDLNQHIIY